MKKLTALLLILVMIFSLAACGGELQDIQTLIEIGNALPDTAQQQEAKTPDTSGQKEAPDEPDASPAEKVIFDGYEMDEVFTIHINGSEEWTPFPGKKDVFFGTDDEDMISLSDDGTTVRFTGEQVGETILGAVLGDKEMLALIRVRAMDGGEINYVYAPPEDHYYIAFEHADRDGDVDSEVFARIGRQYLYSYDTTYSYSFVDFSARASYDRGPNGPWMHDPEGSGLDMEGDWSKPPLPLSAMEEYFMDTFYALGGDVSRLAEYYVGSETLYPAPYESTGIDCWVFDIRGFNGNDLKFWIDPSNGCCLKYEDTGDGDITVVTVYDLNYTAWDNASPQ